MSDREDYGSEETTKQSWKYFWDVILRCYRAKWLTVEVAVVLFMLGRHLYSPLYEQYYYRVYGSEILRNTSFVFPNGSYCVSSKLIDNYTGNNQSYKLDETFSNRLVVYGQAARTVPSIIATMILGPVMDRYGRKIGIILPVIGTTLQGIFTVIIVQYSLDPYFFILANFIGGILGGHTSILASSFIYIADISPPRWRSLRIGLVESAMALGVGIGTFVAGYWLHKINCDFIPPLIFYIGCNVVIIVYVLVFVPESLTRSEREEQCIKNPRGPRAYLQGIKLYFGGLSVSYTWMLYVSTIVILVMVVNIYGGFLIEVYFLKALQFDFNSLQIGIFQAVRAGSQAVANMLLLAALVAMTISDSSIMLIAILFHCGCNILLGLSNRAWELYSISSVRGIEGMSWAGARGLMSKLVKPEQQGALFTIVASLDAVAHLVASSFWPLIFPLTLQHNMSAGTSYLFMAALGFLLIPLVLSLFLVKKGDILQNGAKTIEKSTSESSSSEEEYKPLLTKSWTSNKIYYGVNT